MEPTTRLRPRLTSVILRRTFCLTSSVIGVSFGRPDWEAGTKTRMPFTDTTTPPLFSSVTMPSTTEPASCAASMSAQFLTASMRFLESCAVPSTSFTRTTMASTVSPTCTASSSLTAPSSVNSVVGMNAEYFVPRSMLTSVGVMATTTPLTLSPLYIVLRESSSISSKLFSAGAAAASSASTAGAASSTGAAACTGVSSTGTAQGSLESGSRRSSYPVPP